MCSEVLVTFNRPAVREFRLISFYWGRQKCKIYVEDSSVVKSSPSQAALRMHSGVFQNKEAAQHARGLYSRVDSTFGYRMQLIRNLRVKHGIFETRTDAENKPGIQN